MRNDRDNVNEEKRAILVLGMHRSGTSAMTRLMSLCGAALPRSLMPAVEGDNSLGYWESSVLYDLHVEYMKERGGWKSHAAMSEEWAEAAHDDEWASRLAEAIEAEYDDAHPLWVIKDPRMCLIAPLWKRVLADLGRKVYVILIVRNPIEVVESLAHSPRGIARSDALLLWLNYVLSAERHSRGCARCFVSYEDLISDWRMAVSRVSAQFGLRSSLLDASEKGVIDKFIDPRHRHHVVLDDDVLALPGPGAWVHAAYTWHLRAAGDQEPEADELDVLSDEIRRAIQVFLPMITQLQTIESKETGNTRKSMSEVSGVRTLVAGENEQDATMESIDQRGQT